MECNFTRQFIVYTHKNDGLDYIRCMLHSNDGIL